MRNGLCAAMLAVAMAIGVAHAQGEDIPAEELANIAPQIVETTRAALTGAAVKVTLDAAKIAGMRGDWDTGIVIIADEGLSAERIAQATDARAPLGAIFFRGMTLAAGDDLAPLTQFFEFQRGDTTFHGAILCVRKGDAGPRLEVLGVGDQPLATAAITRRDEEGAEIGMRLAEVDGVARRGTVEFTLAKRWAARLAFAPRD